MKKYYYLFFISWMLTASQAFAGKIIFGLSDPEKASVDGSWGAVMQNTQISISTKEKTKTFGTNEPITLVVRFKNLSTNTYSIYLRANFSENDDFLFSIISPSGKDISPITHKANYPGSGMFVTVSPHQIDGFQFDLNDICKLEETGTYQVVLKLKKRIPGSHQVVEIASNPLFLTLTPNREP